MALNHEEYLFQLDVAVEEFKKMVLEGELDESTIEEANNELMLVVYEHTYDERRE